MEQKPISAPSMSKEQMQALIERAMALGVIAQIHAAKIDNAFLKTIQGPEDPYRATAMKLAQDREVRVRALIEKYKKIDLPEPVAAAYQEILDSCAEHAHDAGQGSFEPALEYDFMSWSALFSSQNLDSEFLDVMRAGPALDKTLEAAQAQGLLTVFVMEDFIEDYQPSSKNAPTTPAAGAASKIVLYLVVGFFAFSCLIPVAIFIIAARFSLLTATG